MVMMTKTQSTPTVAQRSPSVDDQGKDNCGALASTAATKTTVVKVTLMAAVTRNK